MAASLQQRPLTREEAFAFLQKQKGGQPLVQDPMPVLPEEPVAPAPEPEAAPAPQAQPRQPMNRQQAREFLKGVETQPLGERPGFLSTTGGLLLEQAGQAAQTVEHMPGYMAAMQPPSTYGSRGPLPSWGPSGQAPPVPEYQPGPPGLLGRAGQALVKGGETLYPPAVRGTGGVPETLGELTAMVGPSAAAGPAAPIVAGFQFGSPAFLETLDKTKDPAKALKSFFGNAAIAQLTVHGFAKPFQKIFSKFSAPAERAALSKLTMIWDLAKGGAKANALMAAQAGLSAKLDETLTGQDREILREMGHALKRPETAALGGFLDLVGSIHGEEARPRAGKPKPGEKAAPGAVEASPEQGGVSQAEMDWARRFLARPETKPGPIGFPDTNAESLQAATEAERAAGKTGPIRTGQETAPTTKRYEMGVKPSLAEALPPRPDERHITIDSVKQRKRQIGDKLSDIARDYRVPFKEREAAQDAIASSLEKPKSPSQHWTFLDELHDKILGDWADKGLIPKQIEETIPETPSLNERRVRAMRGIETIGKVAGASDTEIEAGRRILQIVPPELLEEEFAQQAKKLRARGVETAPKQAELPELPSGTKEVPKTEPEMAPGIEPGKPIPELPPGTKGPGMEPTKPISAPGKSYAAEVRPAAGAPEKPASASAEPAAPPKEKNLDANAIYKKTGRDGLAALRETIRKHLAKGGRVTVWEGGNPTEVVSVDQNRRLIDKNGHAVALDPGNGKKYNVLLDDVAALEIPTAPRMGAPSTGEPRAEMATQPTPPGQPPKIQAKAAPTHDSLLQMSGLPPEVKKAAGFIAEKGKKIGGKLKDLALDYIVKWHGGKPEDAALLEERARGEVEVEAARARTSSHQLTNAVKAHNRATPGFEVTNGDIAKALSDQTGAHMSRLPDGVRQATQRLRDHIDRLSQIMIDEGMTKATMQEILRQRMGEYVRESYRARVDPKWAEKVPQDVRNRFHSLLVSWSQPPDPNVIRDLKKRWQTKQYRDAIAQRKALRVQIDAMEKAAKTDPAIKAQRKALQEQRRKLRQKLLPQTMDARKAKFEYDYRRWLQGKTPAQIHGLEEAMLDDARRTAENPLAAVASSKLKRRDLSIFKARKGMPDEMKAFLGVEKDPIANYTNTILRQAQDIATHRKFVALREAGLGVWLFEEPREGFSTRVAAAENPAMQPLTQGKDLYTSKKIQKWLFDTEKVLNHPVFKWFTVANALLKGAKTIYQPFGFMRQGWQQVMPLIRGGYMFHAFKNYRRIWATMASQHEVFAKHFGTTAADKALWEELTQGQVVDTNVNLSEIKDLKKVMTGKELPRGARRAMEGHDLLVGLFSMGDNFTKIAAYEVEKKWKLKAGHSEAEARKMAADIVRNTIPTYSRIARLPEIFRRQPFVGTFMAFKAEQVRTQIQSFLQLGRELKDENPVIKQRGQQRAATMAAGLMAPVIGTKAWNMLNGVSQEEDDRKRRQASQFDEQRNLVWLPGNKYMDLSDIDDASWMTDWMNRLMGGEDAGKIVKEAIRENRDPFWEPSLATKTFVYYWQEKDQYGRPIKNPALWLMEQFLPSGFAPSKATPGQLSGLGIRDLGRSRRGS